MTKKNANKSQTEDDLPTEGDKIADAIKFGLKYLGTGDAATTMGALEVVGMNITQAAESIAFSQDRIADAILDLAEAIRGVTKP